MLFRSERGEVTAARVILCANGANGHLHPALNQTVLPMPVYEVATEVLDANLLATTLPENHVLTDVEPNVFSIRWAPGPRLVTAHPAPAGTNRGSIEAAVNRRLRSMLPGYEGRRLEFIWHGVAWVNRGMLPRFVRVADDLTAIQACNGRGIALNTILGRELALWLLMPQSHIPVLPFESPRKVRGFGVMRYMPQLLMAAAMIAGRLTNRQRDSDRGPRAKT